MTKPLVATSLAQLAHVFGVDPSTVRHWRAEGLPGGRGRYDLREVIEWWIDSKAPGQDDSSAKSPALERYRAERAILVRLDRLQREGQLVERAAILEIFAAVASHLRRAGEHMARRCGAEAQELLNHAITEAERELETLRSLVPAESEPGDDGGD